MQEISYDIRFQINEASDRLTQQAVDLFQDWKSGKVYIPLGAFRAMGKRYLVLRDKQVMTFAELYEFGRLYAFMCLVYPDAEVPHSPTDISACFQNILRCGLPISERLPVGEGVQYA